MIIVKGHAASKLIKRAVFRNPAAQWLICALVWAYINFVYYTSRVTLEIDEAAQPYMRGEKNAVLAFWHGRLLMMPMICPPKRKMHVMISGHHDGLIIARAMRFFGFDIVEGSSRKGGTGAALAAVSVIGQGDNVSITPDGPKGPALKVQPGAVAIARMTDVPVIPVTYAARPCRHFRSWDRFVVAFPFSRIHYHVSAPIAVASDDAIAQVEAAMVRQVEQLEAAMEQG